MAKRRSSAENDPFDDPFGDDIDDDDIDNLRIDDDDSDLVVEDDEADDVPARPRRRSGPRAPLPIGSLIVGFIQVIVIALIALALFLALALGAVFAGQRLGVVPTRASGSALSLSFLPTQAAAQPISAPTQPPVGQQPQVGPTAPPAAAAALAATNQACSSAATWWNSQQVKDNYLYFTAQAVNDARGSNKLSALLEQMRIRRDFVSNVPADACLSEARDALLSGFDATIEAARVVDSDPAAFTQQQAKAAQAYAKLTAALWAVNVNSDADSPTALNVARGSGAACGAQAWYASVKPHVDSFLGFVGQINLTSTAPSAVQTLLTNAQAERGNIAAINAPDCAAKAKELLLGALDSDVQSVQQRLAGNADSAASDYDRQNGLFMAWLQWLGVS